MFFPETQVKVYLYGSPVDMRLSFDGLYGLVNRHLQVDPLSGHLFGFINRRATMIKVLYWDRTGWCIWSKRLEQGRLVLDWSTLSRCTDYTGLKLLLEGIEPGRIRKRYRRPPTPPVEPCIPTNLVVSQLMRISVIVTGEFGGT